MFFKAKRDLENDLHNPSISKAYSKVNPPPITKNALFFPIIIIATILHIFQQAFHHYLLIMQKLRLL